MLANSSGQVSMVQSSGLASRDGDRFANDEVGVAILTLFLGRASDTNWDDSGGSRSPTEHVNRTMKNARNGDT